MSGRLGFVRGPVPERPVGQEGILKALGAEMGISLRSDGFGLPVVPINNWITGEAVRVNRCSPIMGDTEHGRDSTTDVHR